MQLLKANTAVDVLIGPFLDSTDGNTTEEALTIEDEHVLLSKNGQALAAKNDANDAGHDDLGYYNCPLNTTDTNTEGTLDICVHMSGALAVRHQFMVIAEAAWDSLCAAKDTGYMDVNVKAVSEDTAAADNLESACDNYSVTRGLTGTALPAAAADAAGGVPISDDGGVDLDELYDSIVTDAAGVGIAADIIALKAETATIVADTNELQADDVPGLIGALNNVSTAEVNAEVDTALSDIHLDHLLAADYDPTSKPGVATALLNELVENDAGVSRFTENALEEAPTGGSAPTAAEIVDEWETQSQADPTGFHVNVKEVNGTAQTANDNGADINEILTDTGSTLDTLIKDIPTVAEFEARSIVSADYVVVGDTIAGVTTVGTCTTNTDMRGTDNAATEAKQDIMDTNVDQIETAVITNAAGVDIAADIIAMKAETALIVADTNELQTDDIPGTLSTIEGKIDTIDTNVDAVLVDTGTTLQAELDGIQADTEDLQTQIGAAGAGLSAIPWNAAWDAEVQSECTDALNAYDPPTDAEMEAAFTEIKGATWAAGTDTLEHIRNKQTDIETDTAEIGAAGAGLSAVPWNASWDAEVQSECNDALVAQKLDHLVAVADADDVVNDSIVAKLAASDGDWSGFDKATESLEAIRDRGDVDWSAGAAANPNMLLEAEVAVVNSQTEFTLATGSDVDDTYNDQAIVLYDDTNSDYPSIRVIENYVGATKTVTIDSGADFTLGADDSVKIFVTAPGTAAPTAAAIVNEWETQSQADPTGFHVNVKEVNGTAQTANDNGADINAILVDTADMQPRVAAIETDTNELQTDNTPGALATIEGKIDTIDGIVDNIITDTGTTLDTLIKDVPTTAEFEARTLPSADYVVVGDTIAGVTTVGTCTTNTDMRGTDNAATEAKQDIIDTNVDQIETAVITNAAGVDVAADIIALKAVVDALENISTADVNAEVVDGLATDTYAEPATGAPPATASIEEKLSWLYTYFRNKTLTTATLLTVRDNADGSDICKSTLSDDGTTFTKAEFVSG